MFSVFNIAHRQSDALHPILGPKWDHPYMVSAAVVALPRVATSLASSKVATLAVALGAHAMACIPYVCVYRALLRPRASASA